MDRRLALDETFCNIINITDPIDGDRHVYFQPPESVKMKYPAIRYKLRGHKDMFANDGRHKTVPSYEVILIDRDPDSVYFKQLLKLPYCNFSTSYASDNLNHFVFTLYY